VSLHAESSKSNQQGKHPWRLSGLKGKAGTFLGKILIMLTRC
jgi:hypothetical protein